MCSLRVLIQVFSSMTSCTYTPRPHATKAVFASGDNLQIASSGNLDVVFSIKFLLDNRAHRVKSSSVTESCTLFDCTWRKKKLRSTFLHPHRSAVLFSLFLYFRRMYDTVSSSVYLSLESSVRTPEFSVSEQDPTYSHSFLL